MSKILLIKTRFLDLGLRVITQPLGLLYIGAILKKVGHEIKIHDCALDYGDLHILKRTITNWKPDFIGISIIMTELGQAKEIMGIIREIMPNVMVIFGGPWPTANPEESIKTFGANFVVIGEGEFVFPQLIDAINNKLPADSIPGTALMVNGEVKINPGKFLTETELDALPTPAWELLDHKLYAKKVSASSVGRRPYISILTSRGCPYQCAYCYKMMGKVFRRRSPESVLSEMEELHFKYGFKDFEIIDDCFNVDRERMHVILKGIHDRIGNVRLHFPCGLRADILEPEDLTFLKQAGTVMAAFAIETPSPRLQRMIHKNLNIEKASRAIDASVKAGIYSVGYFMIGFPTETYEEASETVEFAICSPLHTAVFLLVTPIAGTELANMSSDILKKRHNTSDSVYLNFFNDHLNISAMSDKELKNVFRQAYRRFYLNPKRILKQISCYPNIISLPGSAFGALIKIFPKMQRK